MMKYLFIYTAFLLGCISPVFSQQRKIDSLEILLRTDKEDTNKVKHLNQMALIYQTKGLFDSSMSYAIRALKFSQKLNYSSGLANANNTIGGVYYFKANYPMALTYFIETYKIDSSKGYWSKAGSALYNIGRVYVYESNIKSGLEYYQKALKVAREKDDGRTEELVFGGLGDLYGDQNIYSEALNYYNQALEKSKSISDKKGEGVNLGRIGGLFIKQKKYVEANEKIMQSLELAAQVSDGITRLTDLGNLGIVYQKLDISDSAVKYYSLSRALSKKTGYMLSYAINTYNLGDIYHDKNQDEIAAKLIKEALLIGDSIKYYPLIRDANEGLSEIYSKAGEWQKAYEYHVKSGDAKDTLVNAEKIKQTEKLQAKFQYEKDSAIQQAYFSNQLAIKQTETEKKAAESRTEKVVIWLIASIAIMLVLLLVSIFQRMKGVEKKKLIAEQQKSWLELKALRTQMNPHFLYNTINSIQSFVLKSDTKSSSNYLAQFAGLMRSVLENSRKEKITLGEEMEGLSNYLDFEAMRFPAKFNFHIKVDDLLDKTKILLPPLLIQPFVENAIWHGLMHLQAGAGNLMINFEKFGDHIKCTIDDNGIGRTASTAIKKQSVHKSVGLSIVAERMESMNKMYHWDMKTEIIDKTNADGSSAGTRVELILPLIKN